MKISCISDAFLKHISNIISNIFEDLIGEMRISEKERSILRRHAKFVIMQDLKEKMEKMYSIVRMELRDERGEEKKEDTIREKDKQEEKEKTRIEKEDAAKTS